jgi:hypothetical protein
LFPLRLSVHLSLADWPRAAYLAAVEALKNHSLVSTQNREKHGDRAQRDKKENDSAVVMKSPIQESPVYVHSELGNHKDAEAILGDRKWNCDQD